MKGGNRVGALGTLQKKGKKDTGSVQRNHQKGGKGTPKKKSTGERGEPKKGGLCKKKGQ